MDRHTRISAQRRVELRMQRNLHLRLKAEIREDQKIARERKKQERAAAREAAE